MDERVRQRLQDILDFSDELQASLKGSTMARFQSDREKQRVAERLLEIAGEAATHVPDDVAGQIEGNWDGLRKMRIVLAHAYPRVDAGRIWHAATVSLPALAEGIRATTGLK